MTKCPYYEDGVGSYLPVELVEACLGSNACNWGLLDLKTLQFP